MVFSNGDFNTDIKMLPSINNEKLNSTSVAQEGKSSIIIFTYGDYVLKYKIKQFDMSTIKELANPNSLNSEIIDGKECYYVNFDGTYIGFIPYESNSFGDDNKFGVELTLTYKKSSVDHEIWMEVFKSIA